MADTLTRIGDRADAIDPSLDLFDAIEKLKRERNAIILAHYYQEPDIQDAADFVGDSLQLSQRAAATDCDVIVFAGVHFMAETAKILNPDKTVVLPDLRAGCSLADACPADRFQAFIDAHPGHKVVSYINCSAAVKAISDVICTSSNAADMVRLFPRDQPLIFAPDKNLGAYVMRETGRDDLVLWQGTCQVHEIFSEKKLVQLKVRHPDAEVIAHPECEPHILRHADHIGSTAALLRQVIQSPKQTFIVLTESGILHQMRKAAPHKELIAAPPEGNCACNECPHMRLNTLEKLYLALRDLEPEIHVPEATRIAALKPLERMLKKDLTAA
ncbi:MAG: quinolinate synthase NadA [bacterium]|nr:quinolinate synthase NadA [Myxococcales bacterium]MCB9552885.1 quinolinate synthase NadA [Myxococcales bacterium]